MKHAKTDTICNIATSIGPGACAKSICAFIYYNLRNEILFDAKRFMATFFDEAATISVIE